MAFVNIKSWGKTVNVWLFKETSIYTLFLPDTQFSTFSKVFSFKAISFFKKIQTLVWDLVHPLEVSMPIYSHRLAWCSNAYLAHPTSLYFSLQLIWSMASCLSSKWEHLLLAQRLSLSCIFKPILNFCQSIYTVLVLNQFYTALVWCSHSFNNHQALTVVDFKLCIRNEDI